MIEVQIISKGDENEDFVKQCKNGLNSPLVNIHNGEYIDGNINAARIAVWDSCGGDLLSFVDPEDIPKVEAWQKLQSTLDEHPQTLAAFTYETTITESGALVNLTKPYRHTDPLDTVDFPKHLLVVRRSLYELVRPYAQTQNIGIERLLAAAAYHRSALLCIPEYLYTQRRHFPYRGKRSVVLTRRALEFFNWLDAQSS